MQAIRGSRKFTDKQVDGCRQFLLASYLAPNDLEFEAIAIAARISEGKLEEADRDLDALLKRQPGYYAGLLQRGRRYLARKEWDQAEALFSRLFNASGEIRAADGLVRARRALRDFQGAMAAASQAVERNAGSTDTKLLLGRTALLIGRNAVAVEQFEEIVRLDPNDAKAHKETGDRPRPSWQSRSVNAKS